MENSIDNEILNKGVLECHIDMFFHQLLAVIIQDYIDNNFDWEYNEKSQKTVANEFTSVARVILYDKFQVKLNSYDIEPDERNYVTKNYSAYYNYAEMLMLDIINKATVYKWKGDHYEIMQKCAGLAYGNILNRIFSKNNVDYFGHFFSTKGIDPKLVIFISVYGLFNSSILFKSFRENKFQELLDKYLSKYNLRVIHLEESNIDLSSELIIALVDLTLVHSLPVNKFISSTSDLKITKGTFWYYVKKSNSDYSSKALNPSQIPVVSFLDSPLNTLLKQCQIYLDYIKI